MECHRFCWRLATRTGRDFSGFLRGLFGRKPEWQKHWHRHYTTVRATQCTQGGGLEAFIAYHCEGSTNAQHHCELGGTQGCWRHLLAGLHTNPAGSTPTNTLDLLQTLPFAYCSVFVPWQILVNKSDKSDHPHQREPWCFVEVVNKVGAEAIPTKI